ncbi:MAG: serine/threonine-protein kinase [Betaproteobacteria bacterium]
MTPNSSIATLGRYEILAELGQGAMGVVYKARDPMLDRVVAIKTVNLTLPKDELAEYEARFYQEAKAAGGLSHRNIVTIYDIGRSERIAYMAMEFLEGNELRKLLQARTPIPLAMALEIGAQVAEGLQYAHERQIIHRDIKPANIMVLQDGLVKITDFGIARMRNNEVKTMTGMILGSPKYMSPEQVSGKRADARSDIFSLGVVIYETLTGTSPFVADNIHGVMYQTMNFNPPAPRTLNPDLPEVLNFIVAKALAKNLDDRYQRARDLAHDLREAMTALTGASAAPEMMANPFASGPFVLPESPLTRQQDKAVRIFGTVDAPPDQTPDDEPSVSSSSENTQPALGLSKAFDSFDATQRLAALTGMEKELDEFSETQKIARLIALSQAKRAGAPAASVLSSSTTWRQADSLMRSLAGGGQSARANLKLVWIGSAVLALAAAVLFMLR